MKDVRCNCGSKLAEYTDTEIRIMDRKCKTITVIEVIGGKLVKNRSRSGKDMLLVMLDKREVQDAQEKQNCLA